MIERALKCCVAEFIVHIVIIGIQYKIASRLKCFFLRRFSITQAAVFLALLDRGSLGFGILLCDALILDTYRTEKAYAHNRRVHDKNSMHAFHVRVNHSFRLCC